MLLLLNSTKMMDPKPVVPRGIQPTEPAFLAEAEKLIRSLRRLSRKQLAEKMDLSATLVDAAAANLAAWGSDPAAGAPALLAFNGLVYKHVEASSLRGKTLRQAQDRVRILSGLYGVLRPWDRIEPYRLEMGCKWAPPRKKNLVDYWIEKITGELNNSLKEGEPVVSVSAQEYLKAVDRSGLRGPIVTLDFKEERSDGSLKTVSVHAKMARGAMVRYALESEATEPADLLGFGTHGWEATTEPPEEGRWLFTRPER